MEPQYMQRSVLWHSTSMVLPCLSRSKQAWRLSSHKRAFKFAATASAFSLEKFDAYLWKTRDSDGDGCLESFCVYDTGEDNALRYGHAPVYCTTVCGSIGFPPVISQKLKCHFCPASDLFFLSYST